MLWREGSIAKHCSPAGFSVTTGWMLRGKKLKSQRTSNSRFSIVRSGATLKINTCNTKIIYKNSYRSNSLMKNFHCNMTPCFMQHSQIKFAKFIFFLQLSKYDKKNNSSLTVSLRDERKINSYDNKQIFLFFLSFLSEFYFFFFS